MDETQKSKLLKRMQSLSTRELITIVALRKDDYEPEALALAQQVLSIREDAKDEEQVQAAIQEEEQREKDYSKQIKNQRKETRIAGIFTLLMFFGVAFVILGTMELFDPDMNDLRGVSIGIVLIGMLAILVAVFLLVRYKKRRAAIEADLSSAYKDVKLS